MSSWQPYQAGLQPPAESWYQPDYMPSPVSPSYSQLVSPPPGLPFLPSPPTYATTDSAVASSMFINHYEPPLFDHHPQLLPSPRSLSIPSPLLSPDQALHPIPEYSHYGSMDSNSTTSSRTAEDRMRNQHIEFEVSFADVYESEVGRGLISSPSASPRSETALASLFRSSTSCSTTHNSTGMSYSGSESARRYRGAAFSEEGESRAVAKLLYRYSSVADPLPLFSPDGTTFIIAHRRRLVDVVLPQLFGHGNAASFTRQLNVRSFHTPSCSGSTSLELRD